MIDREFVNAAKIFGEVKRLAKMEEECPCPALFKFAFERGIKLEQLRDEIRLLISMSDDEVKLYN